MPFVLAGLAHVEKEARALVVNQFIAHLGRKPSLGLVKVVVREEKLTLGGELLGDTKCLYDVARLTRWFWSRYAASLLMMTLRSPQRLRPCWKWCGWYIAALVVR